MVGIEETLIAMSDCQPRIPLHNVQSVRAPVLADRNIHQWKLRASWLLLHGYSEWCRFTRKLLNVLTHMLIKQVMVSDVGIVKSYTYPKYPGLSQ